MSARANETSPVDADLLGEERVRRIEWGHPALSALSDPARLIYASLVDGCSEEARETIAGVDVVWRNRGEYRKTRGDGARRGVLETICAAVQELTDRGLLLLRDEETISGAWVRRPWESLPS